MIENTTVAVDDDAGDALSVHVEERGLGPNAGLPSQRHGSVKNGLTGSMLGASERLDVRRELPGQGLRIRVGRIDHVKDPYRG